MDEETAEKSDLIPCYEYVSLLGLTPGEFKAIAPSISASNIIALSVDLRNGEHEKYRAVHSINPGISKDSYVLLSVPYKTTVISKEFFGKLRQTVEAGLEERGLSGEATYKDGVLFYVKYRLSGKLTPPELADFVKIYGPLSNASINAYLNYVPVNVRDKWIIPHQKIHSNGLRQLATFGK